MPTIRTATAKACELSAAEVLAESVWLSWDRFVQQDALVYRTVESTRFVGSAAGNAASPPSVRVTTANPSIDIQRVDPRNVDAVHRARVALRRIRSNIRLARRLFDEAWTDVVLADLSWYAGELGAVRDWDVMHARVLDACDRVRSLATPYEAARLEVGEKILIENLEHERQRCFGDLLVARGDSRFQRLLTLMPAGLEEVSSGADRGEGADVMRKLVAKQWRRFAAHAEATRREPTDAALHDLRVSVKRVRYAADMATPVIGAASRRFSTEASALQDVLGEYHDSTVVRAWLMKVSPLVPPVATFTAGQVSLAEAEASAKLRAAWPKCWSRLEKFGKKTFG